MNFLLFEWHNLDTRWHNSLVCLEFISLSAHVCQLLSVCLFSSGCHITGRDSLPDPLWETSLLYPCNIWFNTNIFLPWMILNVFNIQSFQRKKGDYLLYLLWCRIDTKKYLIKLNLYKECKKQQFYNVQVPFILTCFKFHIINSWIP